MSTLSKVFVVIIFALSVAFLVFTLTLYSKRVKYNEKMENDRRALTAELADRDKQIAGLKTEAEKLKKDKEDAEATAGRNLASWKEVAAQLEQAKKEALDQSSKSNQVVAQNGVLLEQVQKMRAELEENKKVVMALKDQNVRLSMDVDEYKKQFVDAQNDINRFKLEIDELHRDRRDLAEQVATNDFIIKKAIKEGRLTPEAQGPVADVRTKVVDVRVTTGHVAIGAGSDSGIKEGVVFLIHRGEEYIGKVRVTTVWNDFSGGQIIEIPNPKKPIMTGDDAMTSTKG